MRYITLEGRAGILWHTSKNDDEKIASEAKIDDDPVISQAQFLHLLVFCRGPRYATTILSIPQLPICCVTPSLMEERDP